MDQKTAVIGRLCWLCSSNAKTEVEAIEEKILSLEKTIDTKAKFNIDSSKDIELHSALQLVRAEYINEEKAVENGN